jgi:hypothetical protein
MTEVLSIAVLVLALGVVGFVIYKKKQADKYRPPSTGVGGVSKNDGDHAQQ